MSIFSDKLAHVQVFINCPHFVAQLCIREDKLAHNLGPPYFDDVMSLNSLTTACLGQCWQSCVQGGISYAMLSISTCIAVFENKFIPL